MAKTSTATSRPRGKASSKSSSKTSAKASGKPASKAKAASRKSGPQTSQDGTADSLPTRTVATGKRRAFAFIPTLAEVAAEAGVAISTASGVLTGKSYCSVSDKTRQRIVDACNKLGYKANPMARAIHRQQTHSVGLIMPRIIASGILADQLHVLDQAINQAGYTTVLSTHQYDQQTEVTHIRDQIARAIDGIILYPSGQYGPELRELIESRFPLVTIASALPVHTWNVTVDRFIGGYLQMKHLLETGRRNVLVMHNDKLLPGSSALAKQQGRGRALTEAGLSPDAMHEAVLPNTGNFMNDGAVAMQQALKRGLKFDAVATNADAVALGAISVLHQHGMRMPEDVAIIGFDDEPFAAFATPALSTIRQPLELGQAAFKLLLTQLEAQQNGTRLDPQEIVLKPELIVRASTATS